MSAFPSTAWANEVLDGIRTDTPHLALYTSNPTATNTGTEVTGGSYARQPITFSAASARAMTNSAQVVFSGLPGGTITHWAVFDAATAGNFKCYGPIDTNTITETGDDLIFAVGAIDLNMSGS